MAGSWLTYHGGVAHTGVAPASPPLGRIRRVWQADVDGEMYAEPVVSGGRVFVATENDTVYAFDARTGAEVWRRHLGTPVPGGDLPCGDIDPSGITGTPVVDQTAGLLYVVAFSGLHHTLFALDLADGVVRFRRAADGPGLDSRVEQQRGALLNAHGRIYVPFGALYGDCGDYRGALVSLPAGPSGAVHALELAQASGIWSSAGPAEDPAGDILAASGRGATSPFEFQDSVLRLTPTLRRIGFFAPSNWSALAGADLDVGSVAPAPIAHGQVFQIGKEGVGWLLSDTHLGGIGHPLATAHVCAGAFGGTAYRAPYIYVPCTDGLFAVRMDPAGRRLSVAWRQNFHSGPPIIAGGAVWSYDLDNGQLSAFDPNNGRQRATLQLGHVDQFTTPTAVGSMLFAGAGSRLIAVSGI